MQPASTCCFRRQRMKMYLFYLAGFPFLVAGITPLSAQRNLDRAFGRGFASIEREATVKERIRFHDRIIPHVPVIPRQEGRLLLEVNLALKVGTNFGWMSKTAKMVATVVHPDMKKVNREHEARIEYSEHLTSMGVGLWDELGQIGA